MNTRRAALFLLACFFLVGCSNSGGGGPTSPGTGVACAPATQGVAMGQSFTITAAGDGTFSWSAPGAENPTGTGASFSTKYMVLGAHDVTVTTGSSTATCQVTVTPSVGFSAHASNLAPAVPGPVTSVTGQVSASVSWSGTPPEGGQSVNIALLWPNGHIDVGGGAGIDQTGGRFSVPPTMVGQADLIVVVTRDRGTKVLWQTGSFGTYTVEKKR